MAEEDDIRDAESGGHSVFGASGSARFLACPGSVKTSLGLPDTARYEAAEGTVAHSVAEEWLRTEERPGHLIGQSRTITTGTGAYTIPITAEMLGFVGQYVEWMQDIRGDMFVEQRVDYSRLTPIPNQGGTADCVVLKPFHITVGDLKYGVADKIFARNNPQPTLYVLGCLYRWGREYEIERVTIRIAQPRLGHFDEWSATAEELHEFAAWAKDRMHQAWDPNPPFIPGPKQCRYCKALLTCPAARKKAQQIADMTFDDETSEGLPLDQDPVGDPDSARFLDTPTLARLVSWRKWVERLMQAAFDELDRRVKAGENVEGWSLGRGRASRRFRDASQARAFMSLLGLEDDEIETRKLNGPAAIEKTIVAKHMVKLAVAKAWISGLVETRPGGLVLVEQSKTDRIIHDAAHDVFDDEDDAANTEI